MAVWPFSRMRVSWSSGQRVTAAMAELLDSQQAQAADGNIYTDLAVAKNWYDAAAVTPSANMDELICWNPGDRYWYIFGTDGSGDTVGARSVSGRSNTWTTLTIPSAGTLSQGSGRAAAANSSGVIIIGGNAGASASKIRESANGTTWNARNTTASSTEVVVSAMWHSGASLFIIGLNNTAATNVETSPDGQTWTQRTGLPNSHSRGPMCTNGTIALIFANPSVGNTNKCVSTTNGTSYTERTLPTSQVWHGAYWDPRYSRFVAFGDSNWAYSADGITWTDGGANGVSLSGNAWPTIGVCNIGRVHLLYGVGDDKAYAGYYDGVTMKQWLVLDSGDHSHAGASDGQFAILQDGLAEFLRTFSGGL